MMGETVEQCPGHPPGGSRPDGFPPVRSLSRFLRCPSLAPRSRTGAVSRTADALLRHGPSIDIHVAPLARHGARGAPPAGALIDTGTRHDCIDAAFAERLRLPVVDTVEVLTPTGHHTIAVYAGLVFVLRLDLQRFGSFVGIDFTYAGSPHRVVLGRSFLEEVILIYDGLRGQVTFASSPDRE